jgi:hypothetical protein
MKAERAYIGFATVAQLFDGTTNMVGRGVDQVDAPDVLLRNIRVTIIPTMNAAASRLR